MAGNDLGGAADDHLMDIAADPDLLMAVGNRDVVVVRPVSQHGQRVDPCALLVAHIKRHWRQRHQRFAVTQKPFADALTVATQNVALPVAALLLQRCVEGVPALVAGKWRDVVPPGEANHPLYIAFVVTLECLRCVLRRISRTTFTAGSFELIDFCLMKCLQSVPRALTADTGCMGPLMLTCHQRKMSPPSLWRSMLATALLIGISSYVQIFKIG